MGHDIHEHEQGEAIGSSVLRSSVIGAFLEGDFHKIIDGFFGNLWGVSRFLVLSIFFFGLLSVLSLQIPNLILFATEWLIGTAPVWIPIALLVGMWKIWLWYARALYLSKIKPILLEVKFPRDLVRSPRAMENALSQLWNDSGETTFMNRVWQGQVRQIYSLEIASFGGEIHFYVWCWSKWRQQTEASLYAYYPEIELIEVEDYASKFHYDPEKHGVFPTDWRYEPKNDAYPIKTYVDFELDKDPKEEYKIDPLAEVLEHLGDIRPDEQAWIQIVFTLCKDVRKKPGGRYWETQSRYEGLLSDEVQKIRKEATGNLENKDEEWKRFARIQLYRYTEVIRAIDRNMGKHPFNVGVRGVYIGPPEIFSSSRYYSIRWIWRPFGNAQYQNQLRPRRWANPFDYPWQDLFGMRYKLMVRRFFDAYRRRSMFYSPWIMPYNMMSTEVIASLWHPPTSAIATPGLERIPAKKAEPPPNLPK
jgi:hypothetical protein